MRPESVYSTVRRSIAHREDTLVSYVSHRWQCESRLTCRSRRADLTTSGWADCQSTRRQHRHQSKGHESHWKRERAYDKANYHGHADLGGARHRGSQAYCEPPGLRGHQAVELGQEGWLRNAQSHAQQDGDPHLRNHARHRWSKYERHTPARHTPKQRSPSRYVSSEAPNDRRDHNPCQRHQGDEHPRRRLGETLIMKQQRVI